ncbi:uncharacterized protein K02A2.6-like [Nematostella vectensis]|uniref:uncharacterized protein K02A2.6-like n=1 Tax=Nematostella vectensis TaxID=45351 RepID=UPI002077468C|nr:uncharacterized protein K02A2.6-like [Nematostella vectensis]
MIDTAVDQCFNCQVATKSHKEEPIKPTQIPSKPWKTISTDFGGPYPDGHYNLVVIDKRSRYPVVERVPSTSLGPVKERMKNIFAAYGTPKRVESDNGPPFNSGDYEEFAKEEGFDPHRITPGHPRANGESEKFMQTLNKTERIATLEGKDKYERQEAIHNMLVTYRSTLHPATGVTPYEAMRGVSVRTKLDYTPPTTERTAKEEAIDARDGEYKK